MDGAMNPTWPFPRLPELFFWRCVYWARRRRRTTHRARRPRRRAKDFSVQHARADDVRWIMMRAGDNVARVRARRGSAHRLPFGDGSYGDIRRDKLLERVFELIPRQVGVGKLLAALLRRLFQH